MNPDIIVFGPNGQIGAPGTPGSPASPDFTGDPPAQGGTCDKKGNCTCALSGTAGGPGNPGNYGIAGGQAPKAPTLCLIVGRLVSDLVIQTQGGAGGVGGAGGTGSGGGKGQDGGINAASCLKAGWWHDAACQPTLGGIGGNAGRGMDGMPGGGGGDGGDIYIYYGEKQGVDPQGASYQVFGTSVPGEVGMGGAPGKAGNPGAGGMNEAVGNSPATQQPGGNTSIGGNWGPNGSPPGNPGIVSAQMLPSAS
ncbi:MAG: hypothetical protein V4726_06620 [Verrucomicrobiota bacterium]